MVRIIALAALALASPAGAMQQQPTSAAATTNPQLVCKHVVSAQASATPYKMCLTRSEWAQRAAQDAKDANRIVCRYQDVPGSRFRSKKICQAASAWAEHKRLEREHVEGIQRNVCVKGGGC